MIVLIDNYDTNITRTQTQTHCVNHLHLQSMSTDYIIKVCRYIYRYHRNVDSEAILKRMHCSRMHTTCSLVISHSICPLPHMPPATHSPLPCTPTMHAPLPCMPPAIHASTTHTPCHVQPPAMHIPLLPCMPPPAMHATLPCMPPAMHTPSPCGQNS